MDVFQQFFEYAGVRYHHILDPANGEPARGVRNATVVAATTEQADALATALFVSGPADGIEMLEGIPAAEGLVVDSSGVMHWTGGMTAYLEDEADPAAVSE